jgi:Tol biopolymer transport system component
MRRVFKVGAFLFGGMVFLLADTPAIQALGEPVAITAAEDLYMSPVWSPSGHTIAVTGSHYSGIYLVSFPEGEVVQLSDDPAAGFGMAWNHEGTEIAARISRYENRRRNNAVAVFDAITGQKRMISEFSSRLAGTPKWTESDQQVYMSGGGRLSLYTADPSLQKVSSTAPRERIVYADDKRIQIREAASENDVVMQTAEGRILNLLPAPDGSKLVYEVMGGSIWVVNSDGSTPVDLGAGDGPVWNPDGTKIAFAITTDDGHQFLSADIYVVNADGSGLVNLTKTDDAMEVHPTWSPDGRYIAYEVMDTGQIAVQEVR